VLKVKKDAKKYETIDVQGHDGKTHTVVRMKDNYSNLLDYIIIKDIIKQDKK